MTNGANKHAVQIEFETAFSTTHYRLIVLKWLYFMIL